MQYAPSAAVYLPRYQKDPKGSSNVTFGNEKQRKTMKQMSAERKGWGKEERKGGERQNKTKEEERGGKNCKEKEKRMKGIEKRGDG